MLWITCWRFIVVEIEVGVRDLFCLLVLLIPMILPNNSAPYHVALRPTEVSLESLSSVEDVGGESCSGGCAWILYDFFLDNAVQFLAALTR